jgi:PIN domain nuclease of toxin-antitoxin system
MSGLLLDSHPLVWIAEDTAIARNAEIAIARAGESRTLYVSPISAWEIGVASTKKNHTLRPPLNGLTPDAWFTRMVEELNLQLTPFSMDIALEAAKLPAVYGSGDPGDCFLIATAHVQKLSLITRDARILAFSADNPNYLSTIRC